MATQRTLKLNLLADVDKFGKGLRQAGQDTQTFGGKVAKFGKMAGAAFAAAGAAAAGYAIKIGIDGVKAAIEDEQSQKLLAKALQNTTGATDAQIKASEDWISTQQLAKGISDSKLRPALANLARATGSVTKAQELTNLAMDISVATGKDLETVSLTLGKAYDGNFGALTKLGIPLDEGIKKSKDFNLVQDELVRLFGGAAKANTETYAGQLAILTERWDEMKESLGVKLLPKLKDLLDIVNRVAKAMSGEDPQGLSNRARELAGEFKGDGAESLGRSLVNIADSFGKLFAAMTSSEATSGLTALQTTANSINNIAKAIDKLTTAYAKIKPILNLLPGEIVKNKLWDWLTSDASTGSAMGGTVRAGQPVRVGEFGKEVFIPNSSGQIIPNHKLGGGGGNTFILNGIVDAESARRTIERIMQNSTLRTGQVNLAGSPL
jgi:hypothetical protein